ncbi:hypothetical protein HYS82_02005 [Candidatus Amesbacteria bacterium]|nr:hypothetical protein [Candidatus Amesbacteria bacterium]MBI2587207.1 hypothetical protein [Candidatus Amesbacteria bacterium]
MIILHGDNQIASREQFLAAKQSATKQGLNIVEFSGDRINLPDLTQAVESKSLFGSANAIFIESLFSSRPSNTKKQLIDYLTTKQNENIVIWEPKDVSTQLKNIPSTKFDLPKYIFTFLDNPTLNSFHKCLEVLPVEQIFASLATRVHKNLLGVGRISKKINPKDLLDIEYKQKTSSPPYDLTTALEIFFSKISPS